MALRPPPLNFWINDYSNKGDVANTGVSGVFAKTPVPYILSAIVVSAAIACAHDIKVLPNNPLLHRRLALVQQVLNNTKVVNPTDDLLYVRREAFEQLFWNRRNLQYAIQYGAVIDSSTGCSYKNVVDDYLLTACSKCNSRTCDFHIYYKAIVDKGVKEAFRCFIPSRFS